MADEIGGGEDNVNDNMGNQLQLLPGNTRTVETGCLFGLSCDSLQSVALHCAKS